MNVFCNGCGMCCSIIPINGDGILVRDGFQIIEDDFLDGLCELSDYDAKKVSAEYVDKVREVFPDVKFYRCKYLSGTNECLRVEEPSYCRNFPSTALALVPDECTCLGDIFIKNEQLKRKIRMIKEEILDYETLIDMGDKDSASYKKIIENLTRFVTKYKDFGSENW